MKKNINTKNERAGKWLTNIKLEKVGDRKGAAGDFVNFGGFFLILIIIAGGIVGGYLAFFSSDYNIKETEANVLIDVVRDCFKEKGPFNNDVEIIEGCNFNNNVAEQRLIYFKNLDTEKEVFVGVRDYVTQCGLVDRLDKFAKCEEAELSKDGVKYQVITGSNAISRRAIS